MNTQITFSTHRGQVQIQFSNPEQGLEYHRELRAQGQFQGLWIKDLEIEDVKPKRVKNDTTN